jgi:4-hydroxy-tetrahydrodipicolinate synthase
MAAYTQPDPGVSSLGVSIREASFSPGSRAEEVSQMPSPRFGQVITAMVTPFDGAGALDTGRARALVSYLIDHGSEGLVVCGTTGESPTLTHEEKLSLFETVVDESAGRAHVIAGTGTYSTDESIRLTKEAAELGVNACLIVTPYYSRPPQNGLLAHFRAVADASSVPLIVYDIPGRTGRRVERDTMVELAGHGNIAAIKEVFSAWDNGKTEEARRAYLELLPLFSTIMGVTTSPIPVKRALEILGVEVGKPRLPLVAPTDAEERKIVAALEGAGLL